MCTYLFDPLIHWMFVLVCEAHMYLEDNVRLCVPVICVC